MPHNKNTDRTRRRLLRWIALASFLVMAIYLFFPHIFGEDWADEAAHHTPADPFADSLDHLPPESVDLPAGSPDLPPLIFPHDSEQDLIATLANDYNLAGITALPPALQPLADAVSAEEERGWHPPKITGHMPEPPAIEIQIAEEKQKIESITALGARDYTRPPSEQLVPLPEKKAPAIILIEGLSEKPAPADAGKGEFVKKRFVINGNNLWSALQQSDLNPYLKKQLEPLRRRLTQGNINRLHILYTDYVKNGDSKPENSKILLVDGLRGATLTWSFYAREKDRKMAFYDYDGNAPELAMDRSPVQYSHITSAFNPARRHPITGRIQAHTGVDFKAAYGAPVRSTGKGTVTFADWQSGYGRIVIISHDNGYETRYAHLSAIDVKAGQSVARGAVIGKVGNSGASTGTHLHFEVRINGIPYDPMSVKIPSAQPLPANYMKAWHYRAEQYRLAMNELGNAAQK
ncbi:MAG: M23 family metallopeptidase [Cardiobacteriaceae bacterium]|nr:M23 family metallopeptidase [Cardiobacteriaceae bacterium]